MSNKVSSHLHQLIKSLSKAEKRYFKVYSSRHAIGGKNNYQLIFDAIDKQTEYDEEAIILKFKSEGFINKFSITKNRLYDHVLKSLDAFHSNSSINAQLKRQIHYAEILYKKSLYKQSAKQLKSAKKIAYKYEKHTSLIEIFMWEKLLVEKDNYTHTDTNGLSEILDEDQLVLEKISNYSQFWNIKSRLFQILHQQGRARSADELARFKSIIDNILLSSEDRALFFETKYLYHHIYSAYYFAAGDYQQCHIHLKKLLFYIEENKDKFKEEPNIYFSVLTNMIYVTSQLNDIEGSFSYLEKLRSLPETLLLKTNEDLDIKLFSSTYSIELTLHAIIGQFEKGLDLVPQIEEGFRLYGDKINSVRKAYIEANISIIYFCKEEYNSALKWSNQLLNNADIDQTLDIFCFTQILNLLIHLELENVRLAPYALKSAQRYLQTRNRTYKFESVMLAFIGTKLKCKSEEETELAYSKLYSDLIEIKSDPFEKAAFEYFDFIAWTRSKINKSSFKDELLKEA